MHESSFRSPKLLGRTRIPSNGYSACGSHPAHRWLVIVLTATGAVCGGSALAAEPAPLPLAWFAGTWHCAGKFESNGNPIEAHLRFDWNETALVLVKHHDDQPPNSYHAVELWGAARTGLTAAIVDAYSGTRVFTSAGWTNESLTWTRTMDAKPIERFVYVRDSEDRMRLDWATSKDGLAFKLGDTLSCERKKPNEP